MNAMLRWMHTGCLLPLLVVLTRISLIACTAATCDSGEYQSSTLVFSCGGGTGSADVELLKSQETEVAEMPAGVSDVSITLTADADLDLRLYAGSDCIVGVSFGGVTCQHETACSSTSDYCISYAGMSIYYSGDDADSPVTETIKIDGALTTDMTVAVYAFANSDGTADYSYGTVDPCPDPLPGCTTCSDYTGCDSGLEPSCDGSSAVTCVDTTTVTSSSSATSESSTTLSSTSTSTTRSSMSSVSSASTGTSTTISSSSTSTLTTTTLSSTSTASSTTTTVSFSSLSSASSTTLSTSSTSGTSITSVSTSSTSSRTSTTLSTSSTSSRTSTTLSTSSTSSRTSTTLSTSSTSSLSSTTLSSTSTSTSTSNTQSTTTTSSTTSTTLSSSSSSSATSTTLSSTSTSSSTSNTLSSTTTSSATSTTLSSTSTSTQTSDTTSTSSSTSTPRSTLPTTTTSSSTSSSTSTTTSAFAIDFCQDTEDRTQALVTACESNFGSVCVDLLEGELLHLAKLPVGTGASHFNLNKESTSDLKVIDIDAGECIVGRSCLYSSACANSADFCVQHAGMDIYYSGPGEVNETIIIRSTTTLNLQVAVYAHSTSHATLHYEHGPAEECQQPLPGCLSCSDLIGCEPWCRPFQGRFCSEFCASGCCPEDIFAEHQSGSFTPISSGTMLLDLPISSADALLPPASSEEGDVLEEQLLSGDDDDAPTSRITEPFPTVSQVAPGSSVAEQSVAVVSELDLFEGNPSTGPSTTALPSTTDAGLEWPTCEESVWQLSIHCLQALYIPFDTANFCGPGACHDALLDTARSCGLEGEHVAAVAARFLLLCPGSPLSSSCDFRFPSSSASDLASDDILLHDDPVSIAVDDDREALDEDLPDIMQSFPPVSSDIVSDSLDDLVEELEPGEQTYVMSWLWLQNLASISCDGATTDSQELPAFLADIRGGCRRFACEEAFVSVAGMCQPFVANASSSECPDCRCEEALVELKSSCSGKTALVEAILKNCEPPDDDTDGDGGGGGGGGDSDEDDDDGGDDADEGIKPFDCSANAYPVQVIYTAAASEYEVRQLNVTSGEYLLLYSIPFNRTDPDFDEINACGINPIDSIVYCIMRVITGGTRYIFIVRVDQHRVEFVVRLETTKMSYAATFDTHQGTYYYLLQSSWSVFSVNDLHLVPGVKNMSNTTSIANLASYRELSSYFNGIADVITFSGTLGDDTTAQTYLIGVHQSGSYMVMKNVTDASGDSWFIGTSGIPYAEGSGAAFGAGWNYNERVFFARNNGDGAFELYVNTIDLSLYTVSTQLVGPSETVARSDGMNCFTQLLEGANATDFVPWELITTSTSTLSSTSTTSSTTSTTTAVPLGTCLPTEQYQASQLVIGCIHTDGGASFSLSTDETVEVADLVVDVNDFEVSIKAQSDFDIQLNDAATGECIVGYGCAYSTGCSSTSDYCISYEGMSIYFSGDDSSGTVRESLQISGAVTRHMKLNVRSWGSSTATATMSYGDFAADCPEILPGCANCSSYVGCGKSEVPVCDGSLVVHCNEPYPTSSSFSSTSSTSTSTTTFTPTRLPNGCMSDEFQSSELVLFCSGGSGSSPVALRKRETASVAKIPVEAVDVQIQLTADVDLDLRLIDTSTGECIVGFGCLYSEACANNDDYCITYSGMAMHFSGDDWSAPVTERIAISGSVTLDLELEVIAWASGAGEANYSYAALGECPAILPGCSTCSAYIGCEEPETPVCNGSTIVQCVEEEPPTTTEVTTNPPWLHDGCEEDEWQDMVLVLPCEASSGIRALGLESMESRMAVRVPANTTHLRVQLNSTEDVDLSLHNFSRPEECIVGYGCLNSAACSSEDDYCIEHAGGLISYSGDDSVSPIVETMVLVGPFTDELLLYVTAWVATVATVEYDQLAPTSCQAPLPGCATCATYSSCPKGIDPACNGTQVVLCTTTTTTTTTEAPVYLCSSDQWQTASFVLECGGGSGSASLTLTKRDLTEVAQLPSGVSDVEINLAAEVDLDVQLIDTVTGACIAGLSCSDACTDADDYCIEYEGMQIYFSGDDYEAPVAEVIRIQGTLTRDLMVQVLAWASGEGTTTYSYGDLSSCPDVLPGCDSCETYAGCGKFEEPLCDGSPMPDCSVPNGTNGTASATTTTTTSRMENGCMSNQWQSSELVLFCTGGQGSQPIDLVKRETTSVAMIPQDAVDVQIQLTAQVDLDLQLMNATSGECLVGFGCLYEQACSGEADYCITHAGMSIHFSGDDWSAPVTERIAISGSVFGNLELLVTAWATGQGVVNYSYSGLDDCPHLLPGCSSCETYSGCQDDATALCNGSAIVECDPPPTETPPWIDDGCGEDEWQSATVVLPCDAHTGARATLVDANDLKEIGRLPPSTTRTRMQVAAGSDVDILLYDATTGECIVGYGCTYSAACESEDDFCIQYAGGSISYSGDAFQAPVIETVIVTGPLSRSLVLYARAWNAAVVTVNFEHAALSSCPSTLPGCSACNTYDECSKSTEPACNGTQVIDCRTTTTSTTTPAPTAMPPILTCTSTEEWQEYAAVLGCSGGNGLVSLTLEPEVPIEVLYLPSNLTWIDIHLSSFADSDVQLWDLTRGTCIIGYGCEYTAACENEFDQCINYSGVLISYSGDDSLAPVEESLWIAGPLINEMAVIVVGYADEGETSVRFSYSSLSPCPSILPGCSNCSTFTGCGKFEQPLCDGTTEVTCDLVDVLSSSTSTSTTTTTGTAIRLPNGCWSDEYQSSELVLQCEGGDGTQAMTLRKRETTSVARISPLAANLRIRLTAEVDLDLQLIDVSTGECIVGFGCVHADGCSSEADYCISHEGMSIHFSGDDWEAPVTESIAILGSTTMDLELVVIAWATGQGQLNYSYSELDECPNSRLGCSSCTVFSDCESYQSPDCNGSSIVECVGEGPTTTEVTTTPPWIADGCAADEWQSASIVFTCDMLNGSRTTAVAAGEVKEVARMPQGFGTVRIRASSSSDMDLQLYSDGECLVGYECVYSDGCPSEDDLCIQHEGAFIYYSGDSFADPIEEAMMIAGVPSAEMVLYVHAWRDAIVTLVFERFSLSYCPEVLPGCSNCSTYDACTAKSARPSCNGTQVVECTTTTTTTTTIVRCASTEHWQSAAFVLGCDGGKYVDRLIAFESGDTLLAALPVGASNVSMLIAAETDIDLLLFSADGCLVGYDCDYSEPCASEDDFCIEHNGLHISYSGDDSTSPIVERLIVAGTLQQELSLYVRVWQAVEAVANLEYGQLQNCPYLLPGCSNCSAYSGCGKFEEPSCDGSSAVVCESGDFGYSTETSTSTSTTTFSPVITESGCMSDEFQSSELVFECAGSSGSHSMQLQKGGTLSVARIPISAVDVQILLSSDVDLDLQLIDVTSGACIVGFDCLYSSGCSSTDNYCISYAGMSIYFSGDDWSAPVVEQIAISGNSTMELELLVTAFAYGAGVANYSYARLDTCPNTLPGCSTCSVYSGCGEAEAPSCNGSRTVACVDDAPVLTTSPPDVMDGCEDDEWQSSLFTMNCTGDEESRALRVSADELSEVARLPKKINTRLRIEARADADIDIQLYDSGECVVGYGCQQQTGCGDDEANMCLEYANGSIFFSGDDWGDPTIEKLSLLGPFSADLIIYVRAWSSVYVSITLDHTDLTPCPDTLPGCTFCSEYSSCPTKGEGPQCNGTRLVSCGATTTTTTTFYFPTWSFVYDYPETLIPTTTLFQPTTTTTTTTTVLPTTTVQSGTMSTSMSAVVGAVDDDNVTGNGTGDDEDDGDTDYDGDNDTSTDDNETETSSSLTTTSTEEADDAQNGTDGDSDSEEPPGDEDDDEENATDDDEEEGNNITSPTSVTTVSGDPGTTPSGGPSPTTSTSFGPTFSFQTTRNPSSRPAAAATSTMTTTSTSTSTTMEPGFALRVIVEGDYYSLSAPDKLAFEAEIELMILLTSAEQAELLNMTRLTRDDIMSITLSPGSIIATVILAASVEESAVSAIAQALVGQTFYVRADLYSVNNVEFLHSSDVDAIAATIRRSSGLSWLACTMASFITLLAGFSES